MVPKPIELWPDPCKCHHPKDGTLCCTDGSCPLFASQEECPPHCRRGKLCGNQRIRRKQWKKLSIIDTDDRGRGLKTDLPIKAGEFIVEYVGEAVSKRSVVQAMARDPNMTMLYVMHLEGGTCIDASKRGGIARYINHSCDPNSVVDKWTVQNVTRLAIFAKRNIAKDEELTYKYGWTAHGNKALTVCNCSAEICRRFIEEAC